MTDEERAALVAERERVQGKLDSSVDHEGKPKTGAKERVDAIVARLAEIDSELHGEG